MVAWRSLITELYEPETRTKRVAEYVAALGAEKVLSAEKIEELATLSTVEGLKGKKAELQEVLGELMEQPETRTKWVAEYATALGAEKVLSAEKIEELAALSTVDGLKGKKEELKELAAPYLAKAKEAEGRKELVADATDLANEKVLKPVREYASEKVEAVKVASKEYASDKVEAVKGLASEKVLKPAKELAEPYLAKSTEIAAPYIAKIESKRAELVASKRYEKAVATLKELREHPMETAAELKSQAIDLLKYDNLASYRDYVQSEEFQADTMRLIKVELPAIATDAATRGIEQVKQGATTLAVDIEAKREQIVLALERGYSAARGVELQDLKEKMNALLGELSSEGHAYVVHVKSEGFSLQEALTRIKKMAGAIDSILLSPLLAIDDAPTTAATAELAPADLPAGGSPEAEPPAEEESKKEPEESAETEATEAEVAEEPSIRMT